MHLIDTAHVFRFHKSLTEKYGVGTTGALGWKKPEGQQARFKILSGIANLDDCTVLDAGCGHGDLYAFLCNIYPGVQYSGIEQIPALLEVAFSRYGHLHNARFFQGDFENPSLPAADYILACGALSYRNSDNLFVFKTIEKLFASCKTGLGFNLLSKTDFAEGLLVAYDPDYIKAYCCTLTDKVILIKDYYEDDFTVFMYH
ncbi:class I SAM-dependent methyltransferase [Ferruginibacter sp. SUN106]|uniref:class I SAM-dependent methyltransferase n=1 Tax=Ferruginibacter sp. SUN106 TaxID=2978348 RepID=UPI003D367CAA